MKTHIDILLDNSSSMGSYSKEWLLKDGTTKMQLAKNVILKELLPLIDYVDYLTLKLFNEKNNKPCIDKLYEGNYDLIKIIEIVNKVSVPNNNLWGTPITHAIASSIDELSVYNDIDRKIILITDGAESSGDYKKSITEKLSINSFLCKFFIIGLSQSSADAEKTKIFALSTGGAYVNLISMDYSSDYIKKELSTIKLAVIKDSIEKHQAGFSIYDQESKSKIEGLEKKFSNLEKEVSVNQYMEKIETIEKNINSVKLNIKELQYSLKIEIENSQNDISDKTISYIGKEFHKIEETLFELKRMLAGSTEINFRPFIEEIENSLNVISLSINEKIDQINDVLLKQNERLRTKLKTNTVIQLMSLIILIGLIIYTILNNLPFSVQKKLINFFTF